MQRSFVPSPEEGLRLVRLPAAKIRSYEWGQKAKRRKTTGTGRMRYLKNVARRAKNGFQTGSAGKKVAA